MDNEIDHFTSGALFIQEDRQRTRNRLAQRKHRERKKGAGRANSNEKSNGQANAATNQAHASEPQPIPESNIMRLTRAHSSWESNDVQALGRFDHDLGNFPRYSKMEANGGSTTKLMTNFVPEDNSNNTGLKTPSAVDNMMTFIGDGSWQPEMYRNRDSAGETHNTQEPRVHVGPIITQQVTMLDTPISWTGPQDNELHFDDRTSTGQPRQQQRQYNQHHHDQRRTEHKDHSATSRAFTDLQGSATRNNIPPVGSANGRSSSNSTDQRDDDVNDDNNHSGNDMDDFEPESLESRLERVLNIVEDSGFDSIDSMASTYYTSDISEDSIIHPMQSASHTRRLRVLLSDLQTSYKSWNGRERSAYSEEIVRAAEGICSDELQALYGSWHRSHRRFSSAGKGLVNQRGNASLQSNREYIADQVRELLSNPQVVEFMQKDKIALQELVPETWSMMMELARKAGMQPQERAQIASITVYMLTNVPAQRA